MRENKNTVYLKYTVSFYAAIQTYAVGDLGGKLVGVLRIRPVPPKNFYFLCFAPLQEPENFGTPCSADGARRKRSSGSPSPNYFTKIFRTLQGQAENKTFLEENRRQDPGEKRRAEIVQKKCKKASIFLICRRTAETRKTALQQGFPL